MPENVYGKNTYIKIRNKKTKIEEEITIEEFFKKFQNKLKNTEIHLKIQ